MSTRAEVEALLCLIRDSALNALNEYEMYGAAAPRLQSTDTLPLDWSENRTGFMKTIATLEGACEQLCSTLAPPTHTVLNRVQDYQWICMRTVVKHKIADELAKHDDGVPLNDLASAVKLHPSKLGSILRVLATKHCFRETAPNVFANNRLSMTLITSHPMSSAVIYSSDRHKYIHSLPEYLGNPRTGYSMKINEAVFQYFLKARRPELQGITFYQWMELPSNRDRRASLDKAMISVNESLGGLSALEAYDWAQVTSICDVGAGIGHFSRALLHVNDKVQIMIFDLPETIENSKSQWADKYAGRVEFCAGDFFKDVPAKGCDIYYMRNILHNWTDDKAFIILKNVCKSMNSESRLLVHDPILRPLYSTELHSGLEAAPKPLLANYGAGYIQLQNMNMTMLSLFNARERYISEIILLAESAGLRLLRVYDLSITCMLEFSQ